MHCWHPNGCYCHIGIGFCCCTYRLLVGGAGLLCLRVARFEDSSSEPGLFLLLSASLPAARLAFLLPLSPFLACIPQHCSMT